MIDRFDEEIRAALRAETEGVTADDALLDRIRAATASERSPWRQRGRWVLAAAVVALVAGLAAVLMGDDGQTVDLVDDSTTSTTGPADPAVQEPIAHVCREGEHVDLAVYMQPSASEEDLAAMALRLGADVRVTATRYVDQAETYARFRELYADEPGLLETVTPEVLPTAYLVTLADPRDRPAIRDEYSGAAGVYELLDAVCEEAPPVAPEAERPTLVALVREDGWLVTVDLQTGEVRELYFYGDPNDTSVEGGPYSIDAVDLSPDGEWVYFSTCCEPADGVSYRIAVTGGEPEEVGFGAYPRVSPDGRFVATAGAVYVTVLRTDDVGFQADAVRVEVQCCASRLAWSPDGSHLAYVTHGAGGEERQVALLAWDERALVPTDLGKPDNPGAFVSWTSDGTPTISSGGPVDDDRWLSQDVSYRWLLWVDEEGVVREQAGFESSDRRILEGLPEAIAADW